MPCASASPPNWPTLKSVPSARRSKREAKAREPLFQLVGECVGNVGAARANRSAGGKPGQLGNHSHAGRRPVSQKRRHIHRRSRRRVILLAARFGAGTGHVWGGGE